MFQLRKGCLPTTVQAGLVLSLTAILSACGEQPAPVEAGPARVAATVSAEHDQADLPVITITASRAATQNEG